MAQTKDFSLTLDFHLVAKTKKIPYDKTVMARIAEHYGYPEDKPNLLWEVGTFIVAENEGNNKTDFKFMNQSGYVYWGQDVYAWAEL